MAAVSTVLAALPVAGCSIVGGDGRPPLGDPKVQPPAIFTAGVLKVGVNSSKSPFAGMSDKGIIGLDVDIAAAMADQMGLKLELVDISGLDNSTIGELFLSGMLDMVMGYQPEDRSSSPFSTVGPYLLDGPAVFTAQANRGFGGLDLDNTFGLLGNRIATQAGTLSSWIIENSYGTDILVQYPNIEEAFKAVADGTVEYAAADAIIGSFLCRTNYPDIEGVEFLQRTEGVFIAIAPGNQEMTQAAKDAVKALRDNGILQLLIRKWLGPAAVDLVFDPIAIIGADNIDAIDIGDGLPDPGNSDIDPNPGEEGF